MTGRFPVIRVEMDTPDGMWGVRRTGTIRLPGPMPEKGFMVDTDITGATDLDPV